MAFRQMRDGARTHAERFMLKTRVDTVSGCLLWTGARTRDYGSFSLDGQVQSAHRAAYKLFVGPIPAGMCVCHRCDVPNCVNPEHLFLGTHIDNMRDRDSKGRNNTSGSGAFNLAKTHCPHGHPYAGDNLYVWKDGKRECRTCRRNRVTAWHAAHPKNQRQEVA